MNLSIPPITYPAYPVNGGPFPKSQPKYDGPGGASWHYEPKYNGWRALVHVPSGTMFTHQGKVSTINREFEIALTRLKALRLEWVDCEALERRHNIGRGTLIVLDHVDGNRSYRDRRALLELASAVALVPLLKNLNQPVPDNSVLLTMSYSADGAPQLWDILKQCNKAIGCEFFEGFVAKRADSRYPIQLRSPKQEFPFWMKHRWAF